jgi:hypothetical protein
MVILQPYRNTGASVYSVPPVYISKNRAKFRKLLSYLFGPRQETENLHLRVGGARACQAPPLARLGLFKIR